MSQAEESPVSDQQLRTMRILIVALVTGLAVFGVIVVTLRAGGQMPPPPATPVITLVGMVFAAMQLGVQFILPNRVARAARRRLAQRPSAPESAPSALGTVGLLCGVYQTRMLVGAALLEGPAFFLLIAYLLEGAWVSLLVAGLLAAGILLKFPTRTRVEGWIEEQQEILLRERQEGELPG